MVGRFCTECDASVLAELESGKRLELERKEKMIQMKRDAVDAVSKVFRKRMNDCDACTWRLCEVHDAESEAEVARRFAEIEAVFAKDDSAVRVQSPAKDASAVRVQSPAKGASAPTVSTHRKCDKMQCTAPATDGSTYCEYHRVEFAVHMEYFAEKSRCFGCRGTGTGAYCDKHEAELAAEVKKRMEKLKTATGPVLCVNCRVFHVDGNSDLCEGCEKDKKAVVADGDRGAAAPAAKICTCCNAEHTGVYDICEDCRAKQLTKAMKDLEAASEKKKSDEAKWKAMAEAEKAEKKRKAAVEQAAIEQYYPETKQCAECRASKTAKLVSFCDMHQGKINARCTELLEEQNRAGNAKCLAAPAVAVAPKESNDEERKASARAYAIKVYQKETKGCNGCIEARKSSVEYCDFHLVKVEEAYQYTMRPYKVNNRY
jgi:hypothetical protein